MSDFGDKLAAIGILASGYAFSAIVPLKDVFLDLSKGEIIIICLISAITLLWCLGHICDILGTAAARAIEWAASQECVQNAVNRAKETLKQAMR